MAAIANTYTLVLARNEQAFQAGLYDHTTILASATDHGRGLTRFLLRTAVVDDSPEADSDAAKRTALYLGKYQADRLASFNVGVQYRGTDYADALEALVAHLHAA